MELEERREEEMDVEDAVEMEEELAEPSEFNKVVVEACKLEVRVMITVVVSVEAVVGLVTIDAIDVESVENFDVVETVLLLVATEDELLTTVVVNTSEYSFVVEKVSGVVKDDIVVCWAVEVMEDVENRAVLEDVGKLEDSADEERLVDELATLAAEVEILLVSNVVNILMLEKPVVESGTVTVLKDVAETPVVDVVASEVVMIAVVARVPV